MPKFEMFVLTWVCKLLMLNGVDDEKAYSQIVYQVFVYLRVFARYRIGLLICKFLFEEYEVTRVGTGRYRFLNNFN